MSLLYGSTTNICGPAHCAPAAHPLLTAIRSPSCRSHFGLPVRRTERHEHILRLVALATCSRTRHTDLRVTTRGITTSSHRSISASSLPVKCDLRKRRWSRSTRAHTRSRAHAGKSACVWQLQCVLDYIRDACSTRSAGEPSSAPCEAWSARARLTGVGASGTSDAAA